MSLGRVVVNKVGAPGIIRLVPVRKRHVVGLRTLNVAAMGIPVSGGRERGARASERGVANRGVLWDASLLGATDAVVRRRHVVVHLRASAQASGVSRGDEAALSVAADERDVGNQCVEHVCCGISSVSFRLFVHAFVVQSFVLG